MVNMCTTNKEIKNKILNTYSSLCSEVKCSICLDLYTEPVTLTTCSHTFCKECYMSFFTSLTSPKTIPCPICKRAAKRRGYFEDKRVQSLVKFLKVYDSEVLQKFDQNELDKADRIKRNEKQFISTMESTNKVKRWINSCMQGNRRSTDFLLTSSDDSDSDDIEPISQSRIDSLNKLFEPELAPKRTRKKLLVRRTKSLTNIISRVKRKRTKRHSTGNLQLPSEEIVVIEEYDSADVCNNENEQNNILHLLEEDVLKNFEMEMFGYADENSTNLKTNVKNNYNSPKVSKTPAKNIKRISKIDENSANNLNISSETNNVSKKQKAISEKGNNSAKKQGRNKKNDETSTDIGETSLNSTTPWNRMKTMKKEINKNEVKKQGPKYKQLDISMEVAKPVSKRKKEIVKEQIENAVNKQEQNETVIELRENNNPQAIDNQDSTLKEPTVVNLDDFEAYLRRNLSQNKEENTISKVDIKANKNKDLAFSDEDDIFSISTQKLNLDEIQMKNIDDKTDSHPTTSKRKPEKDKIVKDDQDKNRIPSPKVKKAKVTNKNANKEEQTPKQKYKKLKVITSDKKHNANAETVKKVTTRHEKNQKEENKATNKDEKQQIIDNNLDEIRPCSPAVVKMCEKPFLQETDTSIVDENMETGNFVVDVQVHRSLHNNSFRNKDCLVEMDVDLEVSKQNQEEKNSCSDLDVISGSYNSNKSTYPRRSVNRKAANKDKVKEAAVMLEKDEVIEAKCLVTNNRERRSVKLTNPDSNDVISTNSKEDILNSTNSSKNAVKETNQIENELDKASEDREISEIANKVVNKISKHSENDILSSSENSNIYPDNVPVRRSGRKPKPSAKMIKEQPKNKEKKDMSKSTHKQSGILQKAIDKWKETSSESSTDVQDELKSGLKSVLDQRNTMAANLQNSLNVNDNILSQLSNYLTNSESLFSQSSSVEDKEKREKQCSDLKNISDKPNFNLPEYFLSLPNLSGEEHSKHNIRFYNTAIPYLDNINKLYQQIVSLSSQVNNETENFTNIFSKSLLRNCDSSKNNSDSVSSHLEIPIANKDNTIANLELMINKNKSTITNLELALGKNNTAISNSAISNLAGNKTNSVSNISVQTDVINCPKCSYVFNFNSKDTPNSQNIDILPPPIEFKHINDIDNIQTEKSQTMPILQEIQNVSNSKNMSERCKIISQTSTNNRSSCSSEIKVGKKVSRQLFSSDESENNKKRKFKRIRTPTPDTDSEPMNIKKAKNELYHSKLLYRDDLDIEFDSEMTDTNEINIQKQPDLTGDSEIENYDEYMKKLFVKYDKDIEGEAIDTIDKKAVDEVQSNNIRTVDERRKMITRSTKNTISINEPKAISNHSRTNIAKTRNTRKNEMTNNTKIRTTNKKGTKKDTQDITAKYVDILEQEFKTAQFTKPEPKPVIKPVQNTEIHDHFESIPNTVLDHLLTNISFENAANSTLVEKSADKSQITAAISFENAANSTLVEKSGEKSQMTASMFTASINAGNKSVYDQKKADDTCYTHDIISATMFSEMDNRHTKSSRNVNPNVTLGNRDLDAILVQDNVDDEDLDNEVANITGNQHVGDSIGSDKDIFGDDNIVESTPQKEMLSQRDCSKFELSTNLQNSIIEIIEPPGIENTNSEWLNNIAPPPEFQDTEQRDRNISPKQQSVINIASLTPDILPLNTSIINPSISSTLNKGFHGSILDISSENTAKTCHINTDNISNQPSKTVLINNENISSQKQDKPHKTKPALEPASTGWLSNSKNLNPLVLAQKEKFSPLQIIVNPSPPPRPISCGTPKQKSILNYMCSSQKAGRSDTPSKIDSKFTPIKENMSTISRANPNEITPSTSQIRNSNSISILNVSKISKNTKTATPNRDQVSNVETSKYSACIACTRLKRDETMAILALTTKLNGRYSKEFSKQVSHLVVAVDERNRVKDHTIKYVLAIAHGVWVVSFAWIKDCLTHNRLVNEEPYEVLDVLGCPGPRLSRLTRKSHPLLKNYAINCAEPFISVSKTDLENAIISLGGEIKKSLIELQNEKEKIRLILSEAKVTQDFDQYQMWRETYQILVVDIEWLSRTVGQYQVASVRPFVLCLEDGIDDLGYPYPLIAQIPETPTQLTNTSYIHRQ